MSQNILDGMTKLHKLPDGWKWVKLGEACKIIMGQSPPGHTYTEKPEGLPFFQGKADFTNYFPEVRVWCTQPIKVAEENDILISVRAPVGPVNMANVKCCIGRGLSAIRCRESVDNWYLFWHLRSIESQIASIGSGSTFGAITRDDLMNLSIPLPPLSEQRRIAERLKEIMSEIDKARTACEKQLEAVKALPSAYLREVFESEEAKKWERRRLGEVLLKSPQYGLTGVADRYEKNYIYIRITDIDDNGRVKKEDLRFIDLDKQTFKKYKVSEGDILIARSGSVGRIYLVRESDFLKPAVFASYLIRFKLNAEVILPEFFFYFGLSNQYKDFVQEQIKTVAQPNINAKQYQNLLIYVPPLYVQHRIVNYLKQKMAEVDKLKQAIEKQLEIINALPQSYLRRAFRGEL